MAIKQIQLVMYEGYLGADPEMRYLENGTPVTNFRIGSTWGYKQGEKDVTETTWIKVVAWNKLGEIVNEFCKKGTHVVVTGRLRPGANGSPQVYETKSGGHGANYEMTAESVRIFSKASEGSGEESTSHEAEEPIPF